MTARTRTPSQVGRGSRRKGLGYQADIARGVRPWFPEAKSCRDNGFRTPSSSSPDCGDVDLGTPEFFVSAKDDKDGDTCAAWSLGAWLTECQTKAAARGRTGILIQKRRGYADVLDSWCWLNLGDVVEMTGGRPGRWDRPLRMTLRDALAVLADCGLTPAYPANGSESPVDGSRVPALPPQGAEAASVDAGQAPGASPHGSTTRKRPPPARPAG